MIKKKKVLLNLKRKNKCYIYIVLHNHINIFFYLLLVDVILFIATYFKVLKHENIDIQYGEISKQNTEIVKTSQKIPW